MNKKIIVIALMLLLAMLPMAVANMEIIQGPSAQAASAGAIATGGKYIYTDPSGDTQDGVYYAMLGVQALAYVPNGVTGYAYANFEDQRNTFKKSVDLVAGDNDGDTVSFTAGYTGTVSANVEKTVAAGDALAYSNVGTAVIDAANQIGTSDECFNVMAGTSGMGALLVLPDNAVGNAGASGSALYNIELIGDTVSGSSGITGNEVLRTYGTTSGEVIIDGPATLTNGASAARNQVLAIAGLGTATLATDNNGQPAGEEGAALTVSGMGALTAAQTNALGLDSAVTATVTGSAEGGAWDGSTPVGTSEIQGSNEIVRTETTGSIDSLAETYLTGDQAASLSVLGDIAYHSNSPIYISQEFVTALGNIVDGDIDDPQTNPVGDDFGFGTQGNMILGHLTNAATGNLLVAVDNKGTSDTADDVKITTNDKDMAPLDALTNLLEGTTDYQNIDLDKLVADDVDLGDIIPTISVKPDTNGDPIYAADIALTGATVTRTQMGTYTSPIVTAEAYINDGNTNAVARQNDRIVTASQDTLNSGSGAHLRSHPDTVGSAAFDIQLAGQAWSTTASNYADISLNGAIVNGPAATGDRWDDAGSYLNFDEGVMSSDMGTKGYTTTNGQLGMMTWIQGADLNPRIGGQDYMTTFEDTEVGVPQISGKIDPLVYFETSTGRDSYWLSATVHGGI